MTRLRIMDHALPVFQIGAPCKIGIGGIVARRRGEDFIGVQTPPVFQVGPVLPGGEPPLLAKELPTIGEVDGNVRNGFIHGQIAGELLLALDDLQSGEILQKNVGGGRQLLDPGDAGDVLHQVLNPFQLVVQFDGDAVGVALVLPLNLLGLVPGHVPEVESGHGKADHRKDSGIQPHVVPEILPVFSLLHEIHAPSK